MSESQKVRKNKKIRLLIHKDNLRHNLKEIINLRGIMSNLKKV